MFWYSPSWKFIQRIGFLVLAHLVETWTKTRTPTGLRPSSLMTKKSHALNTMPQRGLFVHHHPQINQSIIKAKKMSEKKERRILVAVDEGEESMHALSWCLNNLVQPNSDDTLILLYSKPPRPVYSAIDGPGGYLFSSDVTAAIERYGDQVAHSVMEKAKKVCANLQPQVRVETKVENGDPRDVICEAAEKLGADVLVMGSHGYGVIKRAFLGSVSNHCAQKAKCPVLIVKKPKS